MKKDLLRLLILPLWIMGTLSISSCGSDDDGGNNATPAAITLSHDLLEINIFGGDFDVKVNTNENSWDFDCSDDVSWCNPTKTADGIHFLVLPNNSGSTRTAVFTITCGNGSSRVEKTLNVTQLLVKDVNILLFNQDSVYFTYTGGMKQVSVNGDVELSSAEVQIDLQKYFKVVASGSIVSIVALTNDLDDPIVTDITVNTNTEKKGKIRVYLDFKKHELFDIITVNGHNAMVFEVNFDGSGRAISTEQLTPGEYWNMGTTGWKDSEGSNLLGASATWFYGDYRKAIGTGRTDGKLNMTKWRSYHKSLIAEHQPVVENPSNIPFAPASYNSPAFLWCEWLNSDNSTGWYFRDVTDNGWYLPAIDEMDAIAELYQSNVEKIDQTLSKNKGARMAGELWSSSESSGQAYFMNMIDGIKSRSARLNDRHGIRAFINFEK